MGLVEHAKTELQIAGLFDEDSDYNGTLGCGYELLPNETPLECLMRMEKEREF